jgi:membrane carboxypeptidase/penicillin-binding protein
VTSRRLVSFKSLLAVATAATLAALGCAAYYLNEVRVARAATPKLVAAAWQRHGKSLTLRDLSPERLRFLLAVEDPRFFDHHGVDLETPGAGMTTITQGLVKLLYFPDGFHPGMAKVRQTLIAQHAFDALVSKEEQLSLLLNMAYMGSPGGSAVHGLSAAARSYFGKEYAALSDTEYQSLVAMLIAPDAYVPGTPAHAERMKRIAAYVSGAYHPLCVLDAEYDGRTSGTVAEEALMAALRLVTDARPRSVAR